MAVARDNKQKRTLTAMGQLADKLALVVARNNVAHGSTMGSDEQAAGKLADAHIVRTMSSPNPSPVNRELRQLAAVAQGRAPLAAAACRLFACDATHQFSALTLLRDHMPKVCLFFGVPAGCILVQDTRASITCGLPWVY